MSNRQLPLNDTDFWWLRYGLGIAVPLALMVWGIYSIITLHTYVISRNRPYFILIEGEQAVLLGVAYMGLALAFFANCYAQYHDKMGFYYHWLFASGALLAVGGIFWCCCTSWFSFLR